MAKYLSFNPKNYEIIYNGVDIDYFKPGSVAESRHQRESMGIEANDKVVLLVATMRREKGHTTAIEALNILHAKFAGKEKIHLVFVGNGDNTYMAELENLVKKYSLEAYVHFEGNQKDVRKYHEIADVFTLTSTCETFSIAALEAMSYGLPLSLTDTGGASEMIIHGKNGMLSKPGHADSIAASWAFLLDARLDKKAIREIVLENYTLEQMFEKYEKAIMH